MRKDLLETGFGEMRNKRFEVVRVTERLCEVCNGVLGIREQALRIVCISDIKDYENLLTRSQAYDRAEMDLQECRIYLYDHDYPGEVHLKCLEKLG